MLQEQPLKLVVKRVVYLEGSLRIWPCRIVSLLISCQVVQLRGVDLDSGDLAALLERARSLQRVLDRHWDSISVILHIRILEVDF